MRQIHKTVILRRKLRYQEFFVCFKESFWRLQKITANDVSRLVNILTILFWVKCLVVCRRNALVVSLKYEKNSFHIMNKKLYCDLDSKLIYVPLMIQIIHEIESACLSSFTDVCSFSCFFSCVNDIFRDDNDDDVCLLLLLQLECFPGNISMSWKLFFLNVLNWS